MSLKYEPASGTAEEEGDKRYLSREMLQASPEPQNPRPQTQNPKPDP